MSTQPADGHSSDERGNRPPRPAARRAEVLIVELQRVLSGLAAAQFAIRPGDLGGTRRIAAFAVRVVVLDEAFVRFLDRCRVGSGLQSENGECGSAAGHA